MRIYTRTGDGGATSLVGGKRVEKSHPRVQAGGAIDELNSFLGFTLAACDLETPSNVVLGEILSLLQPWLFDVGADVATPIGTRQESKILRTHSGMVSKLEEWIDRIDGENKKLTSFVMPGGTEVGARLHVARTVCRRAEQVLVVLSESDSITDVVIPFMNRLSDLLFVMARYANQDGGVSEIFWVPSKPAQT